MSNRTIVAATLLTAFVFCGVLKTAQAQFPSKNDFSEDTISEEKSQETTPTRGIKYNQKPRLSNPTFDAGGKPTTNSRLSHTGANFEVIPYQSGKSWNVLRYNTKTGEAWFNGGTSFVKIRSTTPTTGPNPSPETTFEIKMVRLSSDITVFVLLNKHSGETWYLKSNSWEKFTEK